MEFLPLMSMRLQSAAHGRVVVVPTFDAVAGFPGSSARAGRIFQAFEHLGVASLRALPGRMMLDRLFCLPLLFRRV